MEEMEFCMLIRLLIQVVPRAVATVFGRMRAIVGMLDAV